MKIMDRKKYQAVLAVTSILAIAPPVVANVLISNINGHSIDGAGKHQRFSALLIDDSNGKILALGSAKALTRDWPVKIEINLQGKTVLPGLIDAHGHVLGLGQSLNQLNLRTSADLPAALQMIQSHAKKFPEFRWLNGGGWNQANWKLGRFPTAAELDSVIAERPAYLSRIDGHAAWVNSAALRLAGIDKTTPDPVGGKIERDSNGNPSGILIDAAMGLVSKHIPEASLAEQQLALDSALQTLRSYGVTSAHDAGVSVAADQLFRDYASQGKLTTRIYGMIRGTDENFDQLAKNGPLLSYANDLYSLRAVKLFADGALGSRGAALLQVYSDAPDTKGLLFNDAEQIYQKMFKAASKGYQLNVHAIGDAGNRQILDSYARLQQAGQSPASLARHRIEHAQVVDLKEIPRFKSLGVIASMQPSHATSDMNMAEARVGEKRIQGAYAWQTYLKQGTVVACGSDFPIEDANPWDGIHAAVTRQNSAAEPAGGWYPKQKMSLLQALKCYTIDAAYAAHQEKQLGSLEAGKWADFIVLDRDPFKTPAQQLHKIKVEQTWLAGKRVYRANP